MSPRYGANSRMLCQCLNVTELDVTEAIARYGANSVRDLVRETGAGDGCMACHRALRDYIDQQRHAGAR